MVVIYAEKSSLAKVIANVLHAGKRIANEKERTIGHYEFEFNGEPAILCHGVGHLVQLADMKSYGEEYGKWDLSKLPLMPEKFNLTEKETTKICFEEVKKFFSQADWIINATDPDREGELIFGYIYEKTGCTKPWKRVWIEDLTDEKVRYAFSHLKDSSEVIPLQMAGRARSIADWLVGCNLTIAVTKKLSPDRVLSVGRVQTPTLALVVAREKAIRSHKKTPYWKVIGEFDSFEAEHEHGSFTSEQEALKVLEKCEGHTVKIAEKSVKTRTVTAPLLYNATQLQATAGKKFGWELEKTAKIMQSLYEKKYMTYPRTNSEHLTDAMKKEVAETIEKIMQLPEYQKYSIQKDNWAEFTKRHFDDSKVGSHSAIIPTTNVPKDFSDLTEDEKTLYDLLAKSILRIIYAKVEIEETSVKLEVNGEIFTAKGSVITNNGWYTVDAMPEKIKTLPQLSENQEIQGSFKIKKGETEPPKRYTEADLITAMELAGANIEDEEARTLMKLQKKGLGTDATRVAIIKGLFTRQLIETKGKSIVPTEKGIFLIDHLPAETLKSAEMTGEWEKKLNDISTENTSFDNFVSEIKQYTQQWFDEIVKAQTTAFISSDSLICPICKKPLREFDWGFGCSGYRDGCKFSVRKEICGKKLTKAQVTALIKNGKTGLIKGFKSKAGNEFNAVLRLSGEKITFEFEKQ